MNTKHLKNLSKVTIAAAAAFLLTIPARAEIRSKSNELVVVQPHDLPEQAQLGGNSFFLYSDDSGSTYLYVEQQQGARLTVFDVTDPAKVKLVSTTMMTVPGTYDFVRPIDGYNEMIRFRDNKGVAVLDLHKVKSPTYKMVAALGDGTTEALGETGFMVVNEPHDYVRAIPRDYQVVDSSNSSDPILLATVLQVKHKVVNGDTGTTFLLGSEGLSMVRRRSVENDYKTAQIMKNGN